MPVSRRNRPIIEGAPEPSGTDLQRRIQDDQQQRRASLQSARVKSRDRDSAGNEGRCLLVEARSERSGNRGQTSGGAEAACGEVGHNRKPEARRAVGRRQGTSWKDTKPSSQIKPKSKRITRKHTSTKDSTQ